MFIFIVYAVLVWWGAFHWRRHVLGFVSVLGGVLLCVLAGMAHTWLGRVTEGNIFMPVFQGLLYPYTALLLAVGLCFAFAPAHTGGRIALNSKLCRGCGYDLSGLERRARCCPECGLRRAWARDERHCLHCDLDITAEPVSTTACPGCGRHPRMRTPVTGAFPASALVSGPSETTGTATEAPGAPGANGLTPESSRPNPMPAGARVATFRPLRSDAQTESKF